MIECKIFIKKCLKESIRKWVPIQNLLEIKKQKLNNQYQSIKQYRKSKNKLTDIDYTDKNITHIVKLV